MNHCRDCKHFEADYSPYGDEGRCAKISDAGFEGLAQICTEDMPASTHLAVSPDFGCVQFEAKGKQ